MLAANRVSGVAPLSVFFSTVGTTSPATSLPFHELKYTWSFGDAAGGAKWAYGVRAGVASKNAASGPVAAHVFETPGTYTVQVTSYDGVATMVKTLVVTVTDPQLVFASNTVCVSNTAAPVAGVGGCPAGAAVELMPNWSRIGTLAATKKRILLKRGDAWSMDATANIGLAHTGPGVLAAFGTGAAPRVSMDVNAAAIAFNEASDWRVMDLEVTSNGVGNAKVAVTSNKGANHLLLRLNVHDIHFGVSGLDTDGLAIVDSTIERTFLANNGIGAYLDRVDHLAILGSKNRDNPGNHGLRVQGTANAVISHNQFDTPSATGDVLTVRGKTFISAGASGAQANQDAATWTGTWTENVVVSDNVIDGSMDSGYALWIGPQSIYHAERLRNIIVERNLVKGKQLYAAAFQVAENLTVRNNLLISKYTYVLGLISNSNVGSPKPSSSYIYNNTLYKPDVSITTAFSAVSILGTGYTGVVLKNNLAYGPGNARDGATNGNAATFIAPQNGVLGVNYTLLNNSTNAQVNAVNPFATGAPVNVTDFAPGALGYAVSGTGAAVPVWDDMFETPLTTLHSLGAILQ
ncbi:MAG: hypothetical protein RLZZ618_4136 [Pseudomonadota bacterium]